MNVDYFKLLGIKDGRELPHWQLVGELSDVQQKLARAYPQGIPEGFTKAIDLLNQGSVLGAYLMLLQASETDLATEFGDDPKMVDAIQALAENTHFSVERLGEASLLVTNLGVPNPPSPEMQPSPAAPPPSRDTPPAKPRPAPAPSGPDAFGRVGGEIPPVAVGPVTYRVSYGEDCRLVSKTHHDDCYELHWSQRTPGRPNNEFTTRCFIAPQYGWKTYEEGCDYRHTLFKDAERGRVWTVAFIGVNSHNQAALVTSAGLWDTFPHHSRFARNNTARSWQDAAAQWMRTYQFRDVPPQSFYGGTPWDDRMVRIFWKYLSDTVFWTRGGLAQFRMNEAQVQDLRRQADIEASGICHYFLGLKKRRIAKLGFAPPPS